MREKILFNNDWYFYHGEKEIAMGDKDLTGFAGVTLPHDWSLDYPFSKDAKTLGSGGFVETGIGYYKKLFNYDKNTSEKVVLRFDGAYMLSTVFLNGEELGTHVYGYTPFEFDITEKLWDGENLLEVKVDNSRQPNSRWYTGSGITRNVYLMHLPKTHIKSYGIYAYTYKKNEKWFLHTETEIENPENKSLRFKYTLSNDKGSIIFEENEHELSKPDLWTDETPSLYTLKASIYEEDFLVDEASIKIGVRETFFDPERGFVINGKFVKLRGVCLHHDGGSLGAAVPKCVWERRLYKLKDMGCNALRMSHNPPNPELLDLADEMGFYVMDEAFDEWDIMKWKTLGSNTDNSKGYSEYFKDCHEEDMKAMLLRDRNHPSIVLWSIGNEVPNQTVPDGYLMARHLKEIVKKYDKTRPITQANDQIEAEPAKADIKFLNELEVVGYNYTGRWRERAETLYDTDKRKNPNWCVVGTENTSVAGVRGKYLFELENRAGWLTFPYYSAPVEAGRLMRFSLTHDYVSGEFIWTGIDYLGEAGWPHRSASSGLMDTCGFEKDGFFFYKSIWNRRNPMVYLTPNRNLDIEPGKVIPVLAYTNCEEAELFVGGKSYGRKAYSYPAYGMTERYGHFDKTPIPPSTENLFLSWDVPYSEDELLCIGYNDGVEVARYLIKSAGAPSEIRLNAYKDTVDLGEVIQIETSLFDENSVPCANSEEEIRIEASAAKVIGCDSGNPMSHESMRNDKIHALSGKAFFILKPEKTGVCTVKAYSGILEKEIKITVR